MKAKTPKNITEAFSILQAVRDLLAEGGDTQELSPVVDAVGNWAAKRAWNRNVGKLQSECSELYHRLRGVEFKRGAVNFQFS